MHMEYRRENSPLYSLLENGTKRTLPKAQVVYGFGGQAVHLLESGYVKRYLITKEGAKSIQVIYGPGDFLPLTPIYKELFNMDIYNGPEEYYYEAITPVVLYSVSINELTESAKINPELYKDLFYAAGVRLNSYIHRLESISLGVANKKIGHQLCYLANIFGKKDEQGVTIQLPLTHQTIAEILDMARETITLRISRLQEKGLISIEKQLITIHDLEALRKS